MNLVKIALRYRTVTLVLAAILVLVGIRAFLTMPRTEDPTVTIRTGLVIALYPGATSEQVEKQVTETLEKHIFKFTEVRKDKTFSTSRPGLVVINVELEDHVKNSDLFWSRLRDELNEARAIELPEGVRGPIVNSDFGDTAAMLVAVHGKGYGYRELNDYTDRLQDELRTLRNVGKMAVYGGQSEQIWITSSPERITQYFPSPVLLVQALQQRNIIDGAGNFEADSARIPMRTRGFFRTEDQISNAIVAVSPTGQPVYIKDFADVERRYQDPTFLVRYDGEPSLLLSIEMQKGRNIVQLGEEIDRVFSRMQEILPPDIHLDLVANQPAVVKARIWGMTEEFMLAVGSVILVTIILLPFRVAVIAALAIPVTLSVTLGVMSTMGIALHQVSIAALIVVFGIVVDDAIVIADNYLELLDRKVPKAEAAWRSATSVAVPVLTATMTIICSFLPLLILTGLVGEFIRALPLTVAVALAVSYIVAVMLTPILCLIFIKKGLRHHAGEPPEGTKGNFSLMDRIQVGYTVLIGWFMVRKRLALLLGAACLVSAVALFGTVREQFFPYAERNQFVIEVWMSQGSRIQSTDESMRKIEHHLAGKKGVSHYASFVGQSGPRFYYNVNPQQPDGAYGQIIVNTESAQATPRLVDELRTTLAKAAPEALVIVKELQQGVQMEAPVEVRISGEDIGEMQRLGSEVERIISAVPFAQHVHKDFFNDSCLVDVNLNNELADRLGITHAALSRHLLGAFDGAPVNTLWEGNRPVSILLRLDHESRSFFSGVENTYIPSQASQTGVPLRSIATLEPGWQPSRIIHRNGLRTITVRSFVRPGWYGSDLLKAIGPQIKNIRLPAGYRIEYGGEKANRDEAFPEMTKALGISLLAIFLILLLQFRKISEPLVIMASIPLALPGAVLGLLITHNPFGFTAFMGMISLCGIVVRNAIILVDYIQERIAAGEALEQAAVEAGGRRLRPIFLTTMAAAVGVTPMILSGSSLWSPLASVIAVGLTCSMFFTLLAVPILYVIVKSRRFKPRTHTVAIVSLVLMIAAGDVSAEQLKLTLPEAVDMARRQNIPMKISRAKVLENRQRLVSARADYFPRLSNETAYFGVSAGQLVSIPAGSLGVIPGLGPLPAQTSSVAQGFDAMFLSSTTVNQPLTQLFKIHKANEIASADYRIAEAETIKTKNEIILAVHQLYYSLLTAEKQKVTAEAAIAAAEEGLREIEDGVRAGSLLEVATTASRVQLLQGRQALMAAEIQIADLGAELSDLLGLPPDTELVLDEITDVPTTPQPLQQYIQEALSRNPDLQAAKETAAKAGYAVNAALDEYIPGISLFARHTYQDGAPFIAHNIGIFGAQMTWNIFDWGSRRGVVGQRRAQLTQAEENVKRVESRITVETTKAYRKLERSKMMMEVTREVLSLQRENQRLTANQLEAGFTTKARYAEAVAAVRKAESEDLQAVMGYRLAQAELDHIASSFSH
ncbi:MAG: TolC family protein [Nitrospirales bacterium]|nr:TolC family protein [Nitrospirales bacterium]